MLSATAPGWRPNCVKFWEADAAAPKLQKRHRCAMLAAARRSSPLPPFAPLARTAAPRPGRARVHDRDADSAKIGVRCKICTVRLTTSCGRLSRWRGKSLVTKNTFPQKSRRAEACEFFGKGFLLS